MPCEERLARCERPHAGTDEAFTVIDLQQFSLMCGELAVRTYSTGLWGCSRHAHPNAHLRTTPHAGGAVRTGLVGACKKLSAAAATPSYRILMAWRCKTGGPCPACICGRCPDVRAVAVQTLRTPEPPPLPWHHTQACTFALSGMSSSGAPVAVRKVRVSVCACLCVWTCVCLTLARRHVRRSDVGGLAGLIGWCACARVTLAQGSSPVIRVIL